ncbi:DUF2332 family protein [Defluviimonas sp. WL0024]|uniref:DUF2332 family protein n=1 Tax=Albidovulum salinarum TaxID=2984153 RepID=A0ABT2X4P4_9RHOB|nr:DUF2332 family protein [Defluviimonas sp. WL0024]MCU9848913.1 DUF2332 family protein [Defluviimonas sp. WL0024]
MNWRAAFREQAVNCAALGSPFTARLLDLIAARGLPEGRVAARIANWQGDPTSRGASVPLRLTGALHGLVLERRAPGLAALYPPAGAADDALWAAIGAAVVAEEAWIDRRLDYAPQTNEVGRSAFLIAAARWLAARTGLPLELSELGASAGLNLLLDRYALCVGGRWFGPQGAPVRLSPDWRGALPEDVLLHVAGRAGADLAPPDPVTERTRLLSFIWPDQPARLERMRAALEEAARLRLRVERADAIDFLERRLATPVEGRLHMVFHTVAWQYFPKAARARGTALLAAAGRSSSSEAPLALVAMEADGRAPGAGLSMTLWPGGQRHYVGRADFHGRWIDWRPPEPESLPW